MPKKRKDKRKAAVLLASPFDPNGSYTGVCLDGKFEKPVQDADDL